VRNLVGQLILLRIIEIVATRCQILKLNVPNSISAGALSQTPLVPIGSPLVVSYLTSIVSKIVSLTVFEIFHVDVL